MNRAIKYLFSFRCVALLCALFFMQQATAQTVPVYGDSTRLSKLKNGAGNELIIESSTKNIAGALVNYANGRTHFVVVIDTSWALNDSTTRYHRTNGGTYDITKHSTGSVTSSVAWGSITGTLSAQTDLQAALNAKFNNPTGTTLQYIRGDGSLSTFPTNVSTFTNDAGYITGNQSITWTGSNDVTGTATGTTSLTPSLTVNWANGYPTYDLRYASLLNSDFIASGGIVTWISGYTYNVSPAVYYINGVRYTSPSTNITLSAADATFDRIDVFALTTSGTAVAITGTPTSNPEKPDIDNNTQIEASFAVVEAATTQPTINQEWIYRENADWTTAVSNASINPNSTNSPFAGSKDVEGTAVANTHNITYTRGTSLNISTFSNPVLSFEIKSKASWGTNKKFVLQWFNGTTAVGNAIPFGDQSYGFVSSTTSSYFLVSIPLKDFGALSTVTKLRMQAANTTGTFGFFIDNIQIQSVTQTGTTGIQTVLGTSPINVTTSGNTATVSLNNSGITAGTYNNVTLDAHGIATGGSNVSYLTGNQSITISGDATGTGTTSIPLTLATVNSSPGTFGSASQSLTGTVNGKGLVTSLSAQNIQIAEGQVTNLTTDLAAKQGTLTLTTTGTSGASTLVGSTLNIPQYSGGGGGSFWPLSGTGTLTGVATITSNTANQHLFNGTWTTTANNQYHWSISPTITTRGTANDTVSAVLINPTITAGNTTQWLAAVNIIPAFSGGAIPIGLKVSRSMIAIDSITTADRKAALSVGLNDDFDSSYNTQVIFRSKRQPSAYWRVITDRNNSGQSAAPIMQIVNSSGTNFFTAGSGSLSLNYSSSPITLTNVITIGSSGSVLSTNNLSYSSSYFLMKNPTGSNVPVASLTSNSHLLIGTQTDVTSRFFVNGDASVKGDMVVSPLSTPSFTATAQGTTGSTTITYKVVGRTVNGKTTAASSLVTVSNANATLSSTNKVLIAISDVTLSSIPNRSEATAFYDIYRISTTGTSPTTTGKIGTVDMSNNLPSSNGWNFNDVGAAGDGTTPPTVNSTGSVTASFYKYTSYTSAQISALTGMSAGDTIYCSDCTANDASTGVVQTWNGSAFKNHW